MENQYDSATGTRAVALLLARRLEQLLANLAQSEETDRYELRVARGIAGSLIDQLGSILPHESRSDSVHAPRSYSPERVSNATNRA